MRSSGHLRMVGIVMYEWTAHANGANWKLGFGLFDDEYE